MMNELRPFPIYGSRLPRRRVVVTAGSFPGVSGLSRRQRSLPAVLHCFCCRAAVDRPRVLSRVAGTLYLLTRSGGESEVAIGASLGAPFKESEQLRSPVRQTVSTSKPISPVLSLSDVKQLPGTEVPGSHQSTECEDASAQSWGRRRARATSRWASRSASRVAMWRRLSTVLRPLPRPSSSLARPSLK